MANFKSLPSKTINGGVQHLTFYPNGYGASIVQHEFSYGSKDGLWELAVIKGNSDDWNICYDTPITGDVLGYLTEEDVDKTLEEIKSLTNQEDLKNECELNALESQTYEG